MGILRTATQAFGLKEESAALRDEDWALVQRVQAGEVAAFDALVVRYRERIFSIIYNLTANREEASDLSQDAFIKAFRCIHAFKGKASFYTWLYRIALNTTITFLRKRKKQRTYSFETMQEDLHHSEILDKLSTEKEGNKSLFINELQQKLNEALQTLSVKHRTVVVLHEIENLSHAEIAAVVKCSEGTVRSRLHYAKQLLREHLRGYLGKS